MTDEARSDATGAAEDVVALLMRQHGDIRNLFDEVERTAGDQRRDAVHRLVRLLAVHETVEEEVVHAVARRAFDGGAEVVADRLREERSAKEKLSHLDGMEVDAPEFMPLLRSLRSEVLEHARAEERYEFVQLRRHLEPRRLAAMATVVRAAEATAPTRPHPGLESATMNIAVGPVAAVVDRTRDLVRKAMGGG